MHRKLLTVVLVAGTALGLTACVPDTSTPTPAPSPSVTAPLFASDEDALAAAEKVYREYLAATNSGPDLVRLEAVTTAEWFAYEKESAEQRVATGLRAEGESEIVSFDLQSRSRSDVIVYVCLDVSRVRVLNERGEDVTPSDRAGQGTLEVRFAVTQAGLRVDGSDLWSNSCS